jgi:hypothetical protein
MRAKRLPYVLTFFAISLMAVSCSSGPGGPEPGTPAFYWGSAKQSFSAGDYLKTSESLDRAMKSGELATQALPWSLVVTAGLVRGYAEIADDYELGARANRANPGPFRRQASDYRRFARGLTLQLAERIQTFQKTKGEQVALAFPFPNGTQASPPLLGKVVQGMAPPASEAEDALKLELARAMILTASDAVGAGEDSSKAQQMFKGGEVKVPRATFMVAMARALNEASILYGPKKLYEPDRAKMFAQMASDALKGAPDSKDVKALNERIQKTLKPLKKTT